MARCLCGEFISLKENMCSGCTENMNALHSALDEAYYGVKLEE